MIVEWSNPWRIESPYGTLTLNAAEAPGVQRFMLNQQKCAGSIPIRVTDDDIPQGHGRIRHNRWWAGYTIKLSIELWFGHDPACGAELVAMTDLLGRHVNSMLNVDGRLIWQPSGAGLDERMMRRAQLAVAATPSNDGVLTTIDVEFDTTDPYVMEHAETITEIADGDTATIVNNGDTMMFPVSKIHGATAGAVSLINDTVVDEYGDVLTVVYDGSLPGASEIDGGDYVEVDHSKDTAYLNGNEANRKAGIAINLSDFFPLVPGDNIIEAIGADITILSNGAWA